MVPVMQPGSGATPKAVRPHLVVKLKPGWRYEQSKRRFASAHGEGLSVGPDLPRGTVIIHMVPELAQAAQTSLSEDEQDLARYLHVVFPKAIDAADYLGIVRDWPCVEEVRMPPEIGLPT